MLLHIFMVFLSFSGGVKAFDCIELAEKGWNVLSLLAHPAIKHNLGDLLSDKEQFNTFICDLAESRNLEKVIQIVKKSSEFKDDFQIKTTYNYLAAMLRERGLDGLETESSMFLKVSATLYQWGFPVYPFNASREEIKSLVKEIYSKLGPKAISVLTGGLVQGPEFVFENQDEVDEFADAVADSTSIEELARRLRVSVDSVEVIGYSFAPSPERLEELEELVPAVVEFLGILYKDGFFGLNHIESNPYGVPTVTPECQTLGQKLYALKDFAGYTSRGGGFGPFFMRKPEYILGEFLQIDVQNEDDWTALACWLQGVTSVAEITSHFGIPPYFDFPWVYENFKSFYNEETYSKFLINIGVLLPAIQASGYPDLPLKASYGEIYSTLLYLVENIGPDFFHYFGDPSYNYQRPFIFEPITDIAFVARTLSESKSEEELSERFGVSSVDVYSIVSPILRPFIKVRGDFEPEYIARARLFDSVMKSFKAIDAFDLAQN